MVPVSNWKQVKIATPQFDRIKELCDKSGQTVAFHINKAIANYLADEFPIWEAKLKEVQSGIRKK